LVLIIYPLFHHIIYKEINRIIYLGDFFRRKAQIRHTDLGHLSPGAQFGELKRRISPGGNDSVHGGGRMGKWF
jgi:hypothetical protein